MSQADCSVAILDVVDCHSFGRLHFVLPNPPPTSESAALVALQAQTTAQVGTCDSAQRTTLFRHLSEQYEANQQNVQRLFTEVGLATLRDPGADIAARKGARNFLVFASGGTYYEGLNQVNQGHP